MEESLSVLPVSTIAFDFFGFIVYKFALETGNIFEIFTVETVSEIEGETC